LDRTSADARASDADWIRAALEKYESPLIIYATRMLGDVERARDVVQDTFLKLWNADREEVEQHLAQWLYRVCRNRALDVSKKEVRMKTLTEHHWQAMPETKPHDGLEASPEYATVLSAIDSLPDRQQEVIRLKFQGGLSYKEIAEVMDLTANHVGVLIHNGIKAIREKLKAGAAGLGNLGAALPETINADASASR
jgi:RNA polymerase sigma-70 factor (ECF subfamily)